MQNDVRWIQRFSHYKKALTQLSEAVELAGARPLTYLERLGLIKIFSNTHDLAWKTLKGFIESRGTAEIFGSKDASREAFKLGLVKNGDAWMSMIKSRNLTSHTYDEATTEQIVSLTLGSYHAEFLELRTTMEGMEAKETSA